MLMITADVSNKIEQDVSNKIDKKNHNGIKFQI